MPRELRVYEWFGCCKGLILSGLGADNDDCMPRDFDEVRKTLEYAERKRMPMRGFTATVLTRSQAHYYKELLQEFGYKRVTAWFDWEPFDPFEPVPEPERVYDFDEGPEEENWEMVPQTSNPIAIFVARHRNKGMNGELDTRNLANRAKGDSFN